MARRDYPPASAMIRLIRPLLFLALFAFVSPHARSADPAAPIEFNLVSGTYFASLEPPFSGGPARSREAATRSSRDGAYTPELSAA